MDDEREEELESLLAIFPELLLDPNSPFTATLELDVQPTNPVLVRFIPSTNSDGNYAAAARNGAAHVERDVELSYLPPLLLRMILPKGYPVTAPPNIELSAQLAWLPAPKLKELEADATTLWNEYGRCQILFSYIDHIQQAAERGFDLQQSAEGCLVLLSTQEADLVQFDAHTRQKTFDAGTYDCGVCLEPKKGLACHRMKYCGHVFCRQCLQDFYNNAIKEGDVASMKCLDPGCGEEKTADGKKKRKKERALHPRELLAMGLDDSVVRRYVEMKRKKRLEADKSTVYCPRTWCQGAAKSEKYPPIPADLEAYIENNVPDDIDDAESPKVKGRVISPNPSDRLAVCEKCQLAFCRVCYMGWHGPLARCYPRDPNELSAEEKASYEYIRMHTSPCPYCNAPVQKTMGCNHMNCYQCRTHFCYLCSSWLAPDNPYQHFNKPGTPCYQRLWELEGGDDGQAPEDGRGFAGGARGWEQLAIEVARQADQAEAEAAAERAQAEENGRAALIPAAHVNEAPVALALAALELDDDADDSESDDSVDLARPVQRRGARRPRNAMPARPPARGAAQAVRNHERGRGGRARRVGPAVRLGDGQNDLDDHEQAELQRFLELARRDEEDGWISDGLDDDRFIIPNR